MRDDDAEAPTLAHPATPTVVERPSQPAIAEAKAGSVVGRYKLVERLGAGAMGVVWSAQDPQLDRRIAIKLVHPNLARSAEASERLLREARAMAKLSHRAVVTVHDAGEATGQLFLAMELVEGTTLGAMLRRRDDRDWSRWFAMTLEAGRGLAAAHRADVMHRDFKPDNVLVDRAGRVCVADFGIATLGDAGVAAAATARWQADTPLDLTTTGALMGTPTYMSPQQLRGEPVDARADQFAFCVAMHEAIYGVRPFVVEERGLDMLPALVSAIEAQVLPEPPAGSSVPAGVREVLRRGLAADPEARWPDMDALLDALAAAATVAASVVALPEPPKRRRWWIVAGAAAVAAAVVLVIAVTGRPHAAAVPKRMFEVTLHTKLALAPDGNTIAVGRRMLEVRSLDDQDVHSVMVPGDSDVNMLELDDHELRFAVHGSANLRTWRYRDPAATLELGPQQSGGEWLGRTVFGELVELADGVIAIVDGAREIRRWNLGRRTPEVLAISPDGRRAAYLETERFSGAIVLLDLAGGVIARVERLDEPSALAWRDDHRLVYAIGTNEQPRIRQVEVTATGFGPPEELHRATTGWFAVVVARPDRLVFMDLHPSTCAARSRTAARSTCRRTRS
ncbi:MAG: serine/threonine-protein kinase, partial [Kofleriaceae bacterium]